MKRKILFRGRLINSGVWIEGDLIQWHLDNRKWILPINTLAMGEQREVDPETVGQYTGIESSESLFFEGDITTHDDEVGVIEFERGAFIIRLQDECYVPSENWHIETMKKIGNVHDNPETAYS